MGALLSRIHGNVSQVSIEYLSARQSPMANVSQIAIEALITATTPNPAPIVDTVLTGTATASGGTNPNYVLDGDSSTYWGLTTSVADDWIRIDFGSVKSIRKYMFYQHGTYRAYTMKVQKSDDGTTWVDIETVSIGTTLISELPESHSCRYIRFYGLTGYSGGWRVYTIEIYEVKENPKPVISQVAVEALYDIGAPNVNVGAMCVEVLWSGANGVEEVTGAQTTSFAYIT